jgi:hypothetical protein
MEVLFGLDPRGEEGDGGGAGSDRGSERATVGTAPAFVRMIRDLIVERMTERRKREALGTMGAWQDVCPANRCLGGR